MKLRNPLNPKIIKGTPMSIRAVLGIKRVKDFELRLDTEMNVAECDDDKQQHEHEDTIGFSANVRYTLFDVLTNLILQP